MKSKLFLHHLHLPSVFNFNLIDYSAREGRESAFIHGGGIDASQLEMLNEMKGKYMLESRAECVL